MLRDLRFDSNPGPDRPSGSLHLLSALGAPVLRLIFVRVCPLLRDAPGVGPSLCSRLSPVLHRAYLLNKQRSPLFLGRGPPAFGVKYSRLPILRQAGTLPCHLRCSFECQELPNISTPVSEPSITQYQLPWVRPNWQSFPVFSSRQYPETQRQSCHFRKSKAKGRYAKQEETFKEMFKGIFRTQPVMRSGSH